MGLFQRFIPNIFRKNSIGTNEEKSGYGHYATGSSFFSSGSYIDPRKLSVEGYEKNVVANFCIRLISESAAAAPYILTQNDEIVTQSSFLDLFESPNPIQGKKEFLQELFSYFLITGNTYMQAVYPDGSVSYRDSAPVALRVLNPSNVNIIPGQNGIPKSYEYNSGNLKTVWPVSLIGQSNIFHMKEFNPNNDYFGLSRIQSAAYSIDQHNASGEWNFNLLKNGASPSAFIMPKEGSLSHEQVQQLRDQFTRDHSGASNARKVVVLSGGMEVQQNSFSPQDMDFINSKKTSAHDIALAFGVPMDLINTEQSKFENKAVALEQLWENTILPITSHFVDEMNRWILPRYGDNLKLSLDMDSIPALWPIKQKKRESLEKVTYMTINEKRREEGLTEIDGGDQLYTEFNKIPLSQAGTVFSGSTDTSGLESDSEKAYFIKLLNDGHQKDRALAMVKLVYGDTN